MSESFNLGFVIVTKLGYTLYEIGTLGMMNSYVVR